MLFIDGIFLICANMQALCPVTNHFWPELMGVVIGTQCFEILLVYYYYYLGALKRLEMKGLHSLSIAF